MTTYRYQVVDVFTRQALEGNPLAVFPEAGDLTPETMQKIAKELNLSETVFIMPIEHSECVAKLRIFTPSRELDFAGHPTVGTSFVLMKAGRVAEGVKQFILEENVGPVPVRIDESEGRPLIWLTTPTIKDGGTYDRDICAHAIGLRPEDLLEVQPQMLTAGNPTLFIVVKDKEAVDQACLDSAGMSQLRKVHNEFLCVFVFAPVAAGAYSRMFAPEHGIAEDPATGSSTGPLALFMMRNRLVADSDGTRFVSEQGTKMGRRSILHVHICGQQGNNGIEVGGHVTPLIEAVMKL